MKKICSLTSVVLIIFTLFTFNSCSVKEKLVSLVCDKTEVSAGDSVTVTIHMNECDKVACFQYELTCDEKLVSENSEQLDIGEFTVFENEEGNTLTIAGMVATVYDVKGMDIYSITYKIPDDVSSGTKLKVQLAVTQYMTGLDDYGDETKEHCKGIPVSEVTFKVK